MEFQEGVIPPISAVTEEPKIEILPNGLYKAKYHDMFMYFRAFIPENVFFGEEGGYITFTEAELATMRAKRKRYADFEAKLFKCVELNNKGIKLEKDGEIDAAISVYEQNI